MSEIIVLDHDPAWGSIFLRLRSRVWPLVSDLAASIEHVGSTSVEGLPAKPVIDLTIIVREASRMPTVIDRLATIGYRHNGDQGVPGREAFAHPDQAPAHHLYACVENNLALRNHLTVRDHLRRHPARAQAYGELKKRLAARFPDDIDGYADGKTDFLLAILADAGFSQVELDEIRGINSKDEQPGA